MAAQAVDGTASPEDIKLALQQAVDEMEKIIAANQALQQEIESHGWNGLDDLPKIRGDLDRARDSVHEVARKVDLAAKVGEAYQANHMVGDKESLGRN